MARRKIRMTESDFIEYIQHEVKEQLQNSKVGITMLSVDIRFEVTSDLGSSKIKLCEMDKVIRLVREKN